VIKATDDHGNSHEKEVVVSYEKPKPYVYVLPKEEHKKPKPVEEYADKPPVKDPVYDFTARTKYGICTVEWIEKVGGEGSKDTDVLTKFIGNGIPDTAVKITSEYGNAITSVILTAECGGSRSISSTAPLRTSYGRWSTAGSVPTVSFAAPFSGDPEAPASPSDRGPRV